METSRRDFLKKSTLATAGLGIVAAAPFITHAGTTAPNDQINVAIIGCNSMGFGILKHHLEFPDVRCVVMCDVDENVLNQRAEEI